MSMMDNEQPHQELVKCVVVGDTAVGKTRLICARACNKHVSLSQLLTTHVPTVWAIDQYRIYKDVLERSWEVVDGVNVSLRLWDTFGDHEKDRRFAYGRSDVVLLCFSITNPVSLKNCLAMWYPEIRRFCPQTPVLLVGCKNDLRHMHNDATYLNLVKDRSPLVRPTRQCDLVMPDQARAVARELGVFYYETSVLTYFGVNEAFENAIRAALNARRHQRFWMTNLRKVQRPLLQSPYLPPKPSPPEIYVAKSSFEDDFLSMWLSPAYTDIIVVAGNVGFTAHRFVLAAASTVFARLLSSEISELGARSSSDSSMTSSSFGESTVGDFNEDTECLIRSSNKSSKVWEQLKRRSSCQTLTANNNNNNSNYTSCRHRDLNHSAFDSICVKPKADRNNSQTVLKTSKLITPIALNQCLQFVYTGTIAYNKSEIQELRQAAELLEIEDLLTFLANIQAREEYLNTELRVRYLNNLRVRLKEVCINQGQFADVIFQLDDGTCYSSHRPLLIHRCDVMRAMFTGDFRESAEKIIYFPGVNKDTFFALLTYIYTDEVSLIAPYRCVDLLELANRLCLPRLLNLIEDRVTRELGANSVDEVMELCLRIVEPCKLHNAHQLADWCMNFLCANYNKLCKRSPKLLRTLHAENQEYLREHRWPPVWYLKDYDYFEKCLGERQREEKMLKKRGAGCLFFSSNKAKKQSQDLEPGLTTEPQVVA